MAMSLLSGVGLGGAVILVAEVPAIVIYARISRPREFFAPKTMIVAALLGVVGLVAIYTYLPIRAMMHAPMNYWDPQTWTRFQEVVLSGGGGLFTLNGLMSIPRVLAKNAGDIFGWYGEWLTPAGRAIVGVLGIVGFVALMKRDWRFACVVFIGFFLPDLRLGFSTERRAWTLLHDVELVAVFPQRFRDPDGSDSATAENQSRLDSTIIVNFSDRTVSRVSLLFDP